MSNASNQQAALAIKSDPRTMQFKQLMESDRFQQSLRATLPKHLRPEKMLRVVLGAFQRTPKLAECSPESVLLSVLQSAALGLEPDGVLGHGYLVPYWSGKEKRLICQFIPGYKGLVKLARQSGEIGAVWAEVVYERDTFRYSMGLEPTLEHRRNDEVDNPGELRYAYAVARFKGDDDQRQFVVMNRREVLAIRDSSNSKDKQGNVFGPWKDHEAEMWKKTAMRRLCKLLPLSVEAQQAVAVDERMDAGALTSIVTPNFDRIEAADLPAMPAPSAEPSEQAELALEGGYQPQEA